MRISNRPTRGEIFLIIILMALLIFALSKTTQAQSITKDYPQDLQWVFGDIRDFGDAIGMMNFSRFKIDLPWAAGNLTIEITGWETNYPGRLSTLGISAVEDTAQVFRKIEFSESPVIVTTTSNYVDSQVLYFTFMNPKYGGGYDNNLFIDYIKITLADPLPEPPDSVDISEVILSWNANSEPDIAGYKIHWGFESRIYGYTINVGNVTEVMIDSLACGWTYYFAVTAYDKHLNESAYSEEVLAHLICPTTQDTVYWEGDFNRDERVNVYDLAAFASNNYSQNLEYDANGDGVVNVNDFALLAFNYNKQGYKEIPPINE